MPPTRRKARLDRIRAKHDLNRRRLKLSAVLMKNGYTRKSMREAVRVEAAKHEKTRADVLALGLIVHATRGGGGGKGDAQIICTGDWTLPAWGPRSGLTDHEHVYESEDGHLYTFTKRLVTCAECEDAREKEKADATIHG